MSGSRGRGAGGGGFVEEARCDAERSIFAFSWTTFNGYKSVSAAVFAFVSKSQPTTSSSPSPSSVAGSGIPPSITHLFESYFVRMKFSIFLLSTELSSSSARNGGYRRLTLRREHGQEQALLPNNCDVLAMTCSRWVIPQIWHGYRLARALPHRRMLCICSSVQASRSTLLTRLMWVPMPLWIPEHLTRTHIRDQHKTVDRGAQPYAEEDT